MSKILTDIIEYPALDGFSEDVLEDYINSKYSDVVHWVISSIENDTVSIVVNYIV